MDAMCSREFSDKENLKEAMDVEVADEIGSFSESLWIDYRTLYLFYIISMHLICASKTLKQVIVISTW